ncbi:hypothetical protein GUJ93_ZPchr0002g26476 [Zizania palustris]|uniref:Uncharacterized protein n=1 Tax=Zizania palustris TaxID=103762 RepID=A0A8J5VCI4_ZIZPA|nr:hypothetical protein GUJ93_ZPchr0002g26476 [Zizania palustris]
MKKTLITAVHTLPTRNIGVHECTSIGEVTITMAISRRIEELQGRQLASKTQFKSMATTRPSPRYAKTPSATSYQPTISTFDWTLYEFGKSLWSNSGLGRQLVLGIPTTSDEWWETNTKGHLKREKRTFHYAPPPCLKQWEIMFEKSHVSC